MKNQLTDLLDIPRLQSALDSLYTSSKIPSAIIDNDGKVHTGSGWQDVCTKFHRVHPEARKRCIESDLYITDHIHEANPSITYKCPHGLVDTATPIIIEGKHIGNVFTGQLFLEEPDLDYFRAQAKAYGFDEEKYIDAVKKVPIIAEQALKENLAFIAHLTGMLGEMGLKRAREKETERQIWESERRFGSLFDHMQEGYAYCKMIFENGNPVDFSYISVNKMFETLTGLKGVAGKRVSEVIPGIRLSDPALFEIYSRVAITGKPEKIDIFVEALQQWFSVSAYSPEQGFFVAMFDVITERKRNEEELLQSEKKILESQNLLQAVVEGTTDAVFVKDLQGRYLLANAAALRFGGKSAAEVIGKDDTLLFPADVARAVMEGDRGVIASGKTLTYEEHVTDAEGKMATFLSTKGPIVDENGNVNGLFGIARDITGQKQAEEELRLSRQLLALHVQQTPLAVIQFDLEGRVREWNPAAAQVFGYSAEEAIGQHWTFMVPESVWDQLEGVWEGLVSRRSGSRSTNENRTKDGRAINCEWFNTTLINPDGRAVGVASLVMDVTEREQTEREKERLHSQLQQAMKMEAVGRLAGGVAHDFNNMLTVINGYSELLLKKIEKDSPMYGKVEEIKRAGERAALLTQQLLAFSRKQIIEPKVVHLDHLVAETHKMLTRMIGEDIALQATTGKSLGLVKIDPGQFQQILMNLVVNARDAMPGGGKMVIETANVDLDKGYCELHPYVTPGRYVMLAVSDTGQGMSEEVKAHIFEPFFTTKEIGSGTGLGLATTYGAVHQAGGSIEVYSEVGIGTTIKIFLPRVEEQVIKPVNDDRPTDLPGGTETVLIVEDEGILRNLCVQILEQLGYKVLQARKGTEAIAEVQGYGDRIDLLLTDVVMPGMNGSELATQLVLHNPEMKVLFTSGYTDDVISNHGLLAEGVSFIGKPYTPSSLARKVREVLDKA